MTNVRKFLIQLGWSSRRGEEGGGRELWLTARRGPASEHRESGGVWGRSGPPEGTFEKVVSAGGRETMSKQKALSDGTKLGLGFVPSQLHFITACCPAQSPGATPLARC